jgi:hypothetical protein
MDFDTDDDQTGDDTGGSDGGSDDADDYTVWGGTGDDDGSADDQGDDGFSDDQDDDGWDGGADDSDADGWGDGSDDSGDYGSSNDGSTTDALDYGANAGKAVDLGPVMNTIGDGIHVVVDSALSGIAYGFGGAAGLLGNEQDEANWNDTGNKSLENARASARNLQRDLGLMDGEREPLPYTDSGERCPVQHD